MTFPSSPFPRTERCYHCDSGDSDAPCTCLDQPLVSIIAQRATRFPTLRSSPLWQPTWVEDTAPFYEPVVYNQSTRRYGHTGKPDERGRWFPPLRCGPNGFGDPRKRFYASGRSALPLLFTVDNCTGCVADLQAVELMVYGIAWALKQWPDNWEHRCWFIDGECDCGNESWLSDSWSRHIDHWRYANHADSNVWTRKFETRRTRLPGVYA